MSTASVLLRSLAVALAVSGCSAPPPSLAPSSAASATADAAAVVYVAPVADDDDCYAAVGGAAWTPDGLVLSESTCSAGAGDEDPPDPQIRLVRTTSQRTEQLSLPPELGEDDAFRVEGTSRDGTVYVSTANDAEQALWSLRDGRWAPVIRSGSTSAGHSGDGGPALDATTELPVSLDVGPDGTVYLLEPHAVRAITSDGLITTVAGSDRSDQPSDAHPSARWGAAGLPDVTPDPRPLPTGPVEATSTPMPRLTAMDVDQDGTVWLASHDTVLRLDRDGTVRVRADATTTSPTTPAAALVGRRGSSSSITSLRAHAGVLDLIDAWSGRVLRLQGRELSLLAGPTTDQRDFPPAQLGQLIPPTNVRARSFVPGAAPRSLIVAGDDAIIALPVASATTSTDVPGQDFSERGALDPSSALGTRPPDDVGVVHRAVAGFDRSSPHQDHGVSGNCADVSGSSATGTAGTAR